jgi:hypothetical protein
MLRVRVPLVSKSSQVITLPIAKSQSRIQQIHPHVRVERDSGMCVARDLYELWGRCPNTRMFEARTSH